MCEIEASCGKKVVTIINGWSKYWKKCLGVVNMFAKWIREVTGKFGRKGVL